jgi:tRNA/rRNA methyltransferase
VGVAGTNSTQASVLGGPVVILVEPQLGENIGMAARAMLNCGLTELRLVTPRDGWPSDDAIAAASGADRILDAARLFPTAEAAIADLHHVYATSARPRGMVKTILTPRFAAGRMRAQIAVGRRCGLMFGAERMGLVNDHIALADSVISVPLNPAFASLNLAQAVLVVGHEWFQSSDSTPPHAISGGGDQPAPKADLLNFMMRLESALDECGFLRNQEARPSMVRNLRNLFQRAGATEQELRTMHGVIKCLTEKRKRIDSDRTD